MKSRSLASNNHTAYSDTKGKKREMFGLSAKTLQYLEVREMNWNKQRRQKNCVSEEDVREDGAP